MICSGLLLRYIPYKEDFGRKQAAWLLHSGIWGALVASLCLLGGPVLIRVAWCSAGAVGGTFNEQALMINVKLKLTQYQRKIVHHSTFFSLLCFYIHINIWFLNDLVLMQIRTSYAKFILSLCIKFKSFFNNIKMKIMNGRTLRLIIIMQFSRGNGKMELEIQYPH